MAGAAFMGGGQRRGQDEVIGNCEFACVYGLALAGAELVAFVAVSSAAF